MGCRYGRKSGFAFWVTTGFASPRRKIEMVPACSSWRAISPGTFAAGVGRCSLVASRWEAHPIPTAARPRTMAKRWRDSMRGMSSAPRERIQRLPFRLKAEELVTFRGMKRTAGFIALIVLCVAAGSPVFSQRPPVFGRNAGVSAGHPLTTAAAAEILLKGGNAFDAGVAAMLVGGVVEQDLYGLGGEGLVLVYPQKDRKGTAVVGQGWAPKAATIDWYLERNRTLLGEGLDPAVVPGALHAALTVLERWGTMKFEDVSQRAIEYAERGFPLRARTISAIDANRKFIDSWPDNRRMWLKPDGSAYKAGDTIVLPDLARTLKRMVDAERRAARRGRAAGIVAARDRFYKGDIAREMVAFLKQHEAPWELADFSDFFAKVEEPAMTTYRGYEVYKHSFGSQGPVLLESLNILEQFDLKSMGRNSADYVHTMVEAMKLAYADRDSYYGDQAFVESPAEGLLSKAYARQRAAQIDPRR